MQTLKNSFFLILGLAIIVWSFYTFLQRPAPAHYQGTPVLNIGGKTVSLEIADTDEKRTLGLSGRESLATGHGLLFIFDTRERYGFWMKEMRFPIDIVWIDDNWQVVGVDKVVLPETFPHMFYPPSAVKYVLELNAGEAQLLGIDTGSKLSFSGQN